MKIELKPEIEDKDATPEVRAARLRRLRNMANLSRKDLCDKAGININTYIGYEVARYGGLTRWGAEKVVACAVKEGVHCTYNWLMFNIGEPPSVRIGYELTVTFDQSSGQLITPDQENTFIVQEILLFKRQHSGAIDYIVPDDAMSPDYQLSDVVAGIQKSKEFSSCLGQDCIVQTNEDEILLRKLYPGKRKGHYSLIATNPKTHVVSIHYDIILKYVAPIIWHRKKTAR
ncbi:MAG: hypothetical protein QM752_00245 [Gammaproteobacteria bacterium]